MRKILFLVILTLLLSVVFSSAAFAHQSDEAVYYGDSQSGSVSYGDHGYAWYHSDSDNDNTGSIVGRWRSYFHNKIIKYKHHNNDSLSDRDGERYFYVDDNGVSHYFYLDPDRDYEVRSYRNDNGTTQYYFEDAGAK